jgi:hypothetical protein
MAQNIFLFLLYYKKFIITILLIEELNILNVILNVQKYIIFVMLVVLQKFLT